MHSNKSLILSDEVEAHLSYAVAKLKLLKKELASGNKSQMEAEKLLLQTERDELKAARLELEVAPAVEQMFEPAGLYYRPDSHVESEKAALKAERLQLEAEKTHLKAAQSQLEDAKSKLETAQSQLDKVRAQLETALTHLEASMAEATIDTKRVEAAKASVEAAKAKFNAATGQLNATKIRFEDAKPLFEAAPAKEADPSTYLQIRVSELEAEKLTHETMISMLQKDKLNVMAEVESLTIKVTKMEKKLDLCCIDIKALVDEKAKPDLSIRIVKSDKVFLYVETGYGRAGNVVIKLDYDTTPLTAEKFRVLCTGERGIVPYYKGKIIYSGRYFISIYNDQSSASLFGSHFPPENLTKKRVPGAVSLMYHDGAVGPNMFTIMNVHGLGYVGKHVVIGHVIEGMDLVKELGEAGGLVIECGQLS